MLKTETFLKISRSIPRLVVDFSLVVGLVSFAVTLWGIPSASHLAVSVLVGLLSALLTLTLITTMMLIGGRGLVVAEGQAAHWCRDAGGSGGYPPPNDSDNPHSADIVPIRPPRMLEISETFNSVSMFPISWSEALIEELEWRVFEKLCMAYWRAQNMHVVSRSSALKKGALFYIAPKDSPQMRIGLVHCRSSQASRASQTDMEALVKIMGLENLKTVVLMHAGTLSNVVTSYCKNHGVRLIAAENLRQGLMKLNSRQQQKYLKNMVQPDYMVPTCPSCRVKMIKRKHRETGKLIWSCVSYPECRVNVDYVPHLGGFREVAS